MARIAFLDDSFPFTGASLQAAPLGGIQTATVMLAQTLAARGHTVAVHGMVATDEKVEGVLYRPLSAPWGGRYDLLIANCVAKLFARARGQRKALWLHGPARYLRKPRHWIPYLWHRPGVVFLGEYHRGTWPRGLPLFDPAIIPHGVGAPFSLAPQAETPPQPDALFLSNPRRHLDWLLDVWALHIHPSMPQARLHIYAGRSPYGARKDDKLDRALNHAAAFVDKGVVLHDPLPKEPLLKAMRESRVMLYRGDAGETFCFAAAEAQAVGVPLVTAGLGALAERLIDGRTGFVRQNPEAFAQAALRLLREDGLWMEQHKAARDAARALSWDLAAAAWERRFGLQAP